MNMIRSLSARLAGATLVALAMVAFNGCETKEKVLDIETPRGEIEVERDKDTGDTEVEVNRDDQ